MNQELNELRIVNKQFSVGEYDQSWSKIERFLFIEIYDTVKDFFMDRADENISEFGSNHITVKVPVKLIREKFLKGGNKARQLLDVADSLSKKRVGFTKKAENSDEIGFRFVTMFPQIAYNPDSKNQELFVEIHSAVYEEMVPIESYCQLELKLLSEFTSGNTIRLYEIFKSHSFRTQFSIRFDDLRGMLGFRVEGKYTEWKYFNAKVLKPAIQNINSYKEYDIEVSYKKIRGDDRIDFHITSHKKRDFNPVAVLNLNQTINPETREPNRIQRKYIETVIETCAKRVEITNKGELREWIVSDIINQQQNTDTEFNWKKALNEISKQIRFGQYTEPYCHKYLADESAKFDEDIYQKIKTLESRGYYKKIKEMFTEEQIIVNRFGFILNDPNTI